MTAPRPNDTTLDQHIDIAVERIGNRFHGHDTVLRDMLRAPMHQAYQQGRHDAVSELRTSDEVATELGISRRAVQYRAAKLGVGWQVGPRAILFRPEDVEALRNAPLPGRPKRG